MTDDEIDRIARAFCARTLPKAEWTHAAHFATALWLILTRADILVERDMPAMIRSYNEAVGGVNSDTAGYHETITQASLHMTRRVLAGVPDGIMPCAALMLLLASPLGDKDWPYAYWTRERLMSKDARRAWVAPVLQDLPA
ncbi:hypothetical protein [Sphingobium aromaticiconvertens]|uniref:hypothetical protein n=1 Tax=Sphingobium aromaticiconvertens TaxID=365341 RepID=UPI00301B15E1